MNASLSVSIYPKSSIVFTSCACTGVSVGIGVGSVTNLGGSYAFYGTKLSSTAGAIYVPASLNT